MITAYVGSGGKTGTIKRTAELLRREGKRVLVTTSTHINSVPGAIIGDDPEPILHALREQGLVWAGQFNEKHGMQALSEQTFRMVCREADEVLVEADGSRHLPLKYPAAHEPVIPEGTDRIVIIAGLSGIGHAANEVCHRLPLVTACLGIDERTVMTAAHVQKLVEDGYMRRMAREHPECELVICPTQQDSMYLRAVAALIRDRMQVDRISPAWFAESPALMVYGSGHVARAVCDICARVGFRVTVADECADYLQPECFPMASERITVPIERLAEALPANGYGVLTLGDAEKLYQCVSVMLKRGMSYVGMLGAHRKAAMIRSRLQAEGLTEAQLECLHAPVGLPIRAVTPAEIGVSVAAELISIKNANGTACASGELLAERRNGCLCVITATEGTVPRGVGTMMLVLPDTILDSVGGGDTEREIIRDARCCRHTTEAVYEHGSGRIHVLMLPLS